MLLGMMKFMRGLLRMPLWVKVWLGLLILFNAFVPMFFLPLIEATTVLATFIASALLMGAITAATGFTRLLGLGHVLWLGLLPYLWGQLEAFDAGSPEGIWLRWLIALNLISLILDVVDVARYARGERAEIVAGLDA